MRGTDHQQSTMFSYISAERRVPKDHPLRAVRAMVDAALGELAARFDAIYAAHGRPSIAPEEHFTVDGTLVEAWAGQKSFKRKDQGAAKTPPDDDPGNPSVDFHGEQRRNDTHQSTTDPQALLARKGPGKEAKLSYAGHVL